MFEYRLQVRGYELDSYGHVNNAVYLNYYEQARWELVRQCGIFDMMITSELLLVVTDIKIRFSREAKLFDKILIHTRLCVEGSFVMFHHRMINEESGLKLSHAEVRTVVINKNRQPMGIPDEIRNLIPPPPAT